MRGVVEHKCPPAARASGKASQESARLLQLGGEACV